MRKRRLRYADVMSTIAVFLGLGGAAYAITIPNNSVGRTQVRDNSLNAAKLSPAVRDRLGLAADAGKYVVSADRRVLGELLQSNPAGLAPSLGSASTAATYRFRTSNGATIERVVANGERTPAAQSSRLRWFYYHDPDCKGDAYMNELQQATPEPDGLLWSSFSIAQTAGLPWSRLYSLDRDWVVLSRAEMTVLTDAPDTPFFGDGATICHPAFIAPGESTYRLRKLLPYADTRPRAPLRLQ